MKAIGPSARSSADPSEIPEVLANATTAIAETLLTRGYKLDCVLGSRLLLNFLTELGFDSQAVGTVLLILDPVATKTQMRRGASLQIGGQPGTAPGYSFTSWSAPGRPVRISFLTRPSDNS